MSSTAFDAAAAAFDAIVRHATESTEQWNTRRRLDQLERIETLRCILPALEHELINQLGAQALPEELGGKLSHALADRLRITRSEAARRIHEAQDLGPRRTLNGEPLEPKLWATAAGQTEGRIGAEHVRVIRGFLHQLPDCVDAPTREKAERDLADKAKRFRPDQLRRYAQHLELVLNPDGKLFGHRPGAPARDHCRTPRVGRYESHRGLAHARTTGRLGCGASQMGRARDVQPGR